MSDDFEVDKKLAMLAELSGLLQLARTRAEAARESLAIAQAEVHKISPAPGGSTSTETSLPFKCRLAFVVSDYDWHDVLQLVPVANWTNADGSTTSFPLLICHTEYAEPPLKFGPEDAYGCLDVLKHYLVDAGTAPDVVYGVKADASVALVDGTEFLQPFVPTEPVLSKIEVRLRADAPFPPKAMQSSTIISISVKAQVASEPLSTFQFLASTLSSKSSWHSVPLPTPLFLHPGETYYLAISVTTPGPGQKTSVFWAAQPLTGPSRGQERLLGVRSLMRGALKTYYPRSYVYVVGSISKQFRKQLEWLLYLQLHLGPTNIQFVSKFDFGYFWHRPTHIVLCDCDEYMSSLLGAVFAANLHAPCCTVGVSDLPALQPYVSSCEATHAIGVAGEFKYALQKGISSLSLKCYTIWEAQKAYLKMTNTNKICLVNPEDVSLFVNRALDQRIIEKDIELLGAGDAPWVSSGGDAISRLYRGMSMAAAVLASARRELLLFSAFVESDEVAAWVQLYVLELCKQCALPQRWFKFVTIVASPCAIAMTVLVKDLGGPGEDLYSGCDGDILGDINNAVACDVAFGRIYGLTVADVSAYLARIFVLHYDKVSGDDISVLIARVDANIPELPLFDAWQALSEQLDWCGGSVDVRDLSDGQLGADWIRDWGMVCYHGHGKTYYGGVGFDELPSLHGAFWVAASCLSLAFDRVDEPDGLGPSCLFGPNVIRRGGTGVIGAVDTTGGPLDGVRITKELMGRPGTVGEAVAWCKASCEFITRHQGAVYGFKSIGQYCLLGDPCLMVEDPPRLPEIDCVRVAPHAFVVRCLVKGTSSGELFSNLATTDLTGGRLCFELDAEGIEGKFSEIRVVSEYMDCESQLAPSDQLLVETSAGPRLFVVSPDDVKIPSALAGNWLDAVLLVLLE